MDPRSGVKDYVRLSVFLERHPDRSGGSFVVWRRLRRLFLEDGILVSQPSPLGEGAPQGRIGHRRYERQMRKAEQRGICGEARAADRKWQRFDPCFLKNHSRPFLWKGQTSEARRGWLPRMWECRFTRPTSAPSGHLLPKEGGRKKGCVYRHRYSCGEAAT